MPIPIGCDKCGKKLKVKDRLAGKAIRCPQCKEVLRVPDIKASTNAGKDSAKRKDSSAAPKIDEQDALLRYEEAQKKKGMSAEADAALRDEQKKIIESYDQLTGRESKKGKKGAKTERDKSGKPIPAGSKPKKVTLATKLRDAIGTMCSTLAFKYCMIVVLLGGGAVGSIFIVQAVTGYMSDETAAVSSKTQEELEGLYKDTKKAISRKQWSKAKDCLDKIVEISPYQAKNAEYKRLMAQLTRAFQNPEPSTTPEPAS